MADMSVGLKVIVSVASFLKWLFSKLRKFFKPQKLQHDKRRIRYRVLRFFGLRRQADGSWEFGYSSDTRFDQN